MDRVEALRKLREPFPENQINQKPNPTKAQTEEFKADRRKGIRCELCGQWHHKDAGHLSYVGHAALTDRLLDIDPEWTWKPMAYDADGLPKFDKDFGLWILLTICGLTKPGYGHAGTKTGGDATKEIIGDALRNAAMRFGCALDLWHKGDLHVDDDDTPAKPKAPTPPLPDHGWSIDELEEFETTMDRAYKAFKLAGKPDDYNAFREKWKVNQSKDPAELVLTKLSDFVNKMEIAAKAKVESLGSEKSA